MPCKWPDLRMARMTTLNGVPISNECFHAKYIDTQKSAFIFLQLPTGPCCSKVR